MKKSIKLVALLAALIMTVCVFAACEQETLPKDVLEVLKEMVPDAKYAEAEVTLEENVKAAYTATKGADVTKIYYLEKENVFVKPLKAYIAIDKDTKISAIKLISKFTEGIDKTASDFGLIGATVDSYREAFTPVTGATVSSNTVKELVASAFKQAGAIDDPYGFQFNSKTGIIVDYTKSVKEVVIPSEIRGVAVKGLGENLFKGDSVIEKVIIPASVENIAFSAFEDCTKLNAVMFEKRGDKQLTYGINVFANCTALTTISLPDGAAISNGMFKGCTALVSVGNIEKAMMVGADAFKDCAALTAIDLTGCYQVGSSAFENCAKLTGVTFGTLVNSLGEKAFKNSGLKSFNVPASVTSFNINVFEGCKDLATITANSASKSYIAINNVLYTSKAVTVDSVTSYVAKDVYFVNSSVTSFEIPASVTGIAATAFTVCDKLASITVEAGNTTYVSESGVLYKKNSGGVLTNLVMVPAQYASAVTLYAGTSFVDSNALSYAQKITEIIIEEGNVNFIEIDHVIYRRASATATYFTLIAANRNFEGEVTILGGNTAYTLTGINDGAFAYSKITAIKFDLKAHCSATLAEKMFVNAAEGFKIIASDAWKTELTAPGGKWSAVSDIVEWTSAA